LCTRNWSRLGQPDRSLDMCEYTNLIRSVLKRRNTYKNYRLFNHLERQKTLSFYYIYLKFDTCFLLWGKIIRNNNPVGHAKLFY